MNTLKWYNEVIQLSCTDSKIHTYFDCWVIITALYQKVGINCTSQFTILRMITVICVSYHRCRIKCLHEPESQTSWYSINWPRITFLLWNLKVHYCIQKTLQLASTEPNEPHSMSDPTWCPDCLQLAGWSQQWGSCPSCLWFVSSLYQHQPCSPGWPAAGHKQFVL